jgi:dihydropteroate synthase
MIAVRPRFDWKLRTRTLALGRRTLIMGVLNVTPDSFSDGGRFLAKERALAHVLRLLDEGADIVDIGGESTRPGERPQVSAQEEADRVVPVIEAVLRERPDAVLSVDTYKAQTARAAIGAGAEIVNDVSGLLWDGAMAATCAHLGCGVVLMHTRGRMQEWRALPPLPLGEVLPMVQRELAQRMGSAQDAGIAAECIVLDPGLGFGKAFDENWPLLAGLEQLHALGRPLLVGASRKSFLTHSLAALPGQAASVEGGPPAAQAAALHAPLAAHTAALLAGAQLVRVHDVAAARQAAAIADAIRAAQ